ncbi:MAG: membrane-bound lytic murein transglycosylase B, partial [Halothiobacillaceae bacterium]
MTNSTLRTLLFAGLVLVSATTVAADITQRPDVQQFIAAMAELKPDIVAAMSRPAEAKPWHQYRPIFVTQKRAREGAEFMKRNRETLARAEATYGVPPQIVAAIIGVESRYGQHHGKHRVLDALATLAFDFPRRAHYFRTELTQFLLLARDEGVDPASVMGSYA